MCCLWPHHKNKKKHPCMVLHQMV